MSIDEKDKKLGEALARVRDGLQGLQPAAQAIDEYLNFLGKPLEPRSEVKGLTEAVQKAPWDPNKIPWTEDSGFRGPYQRYPSKEKKAEATDDYKTMLADLKAHNGRLTRDGFFYWVFEDDATVGRKETKKSKQ